MRNKQQAANTPDFNYEFFEAMERWRPKIPWRPYEPKVSSAHRRE